MTTKIAALLRAAIVGLALALLIVPAAPLGGVVPIPTVGGEAEAYPGLICGSGSTYDYVMCDNGPGEFGNGGGGWFHDPCMFDMKIFNWNTCQMCFTVSVASWGYTTCEGGVGSDRVAGFFFHRREEATE